MYLFIAILLIAIILGTVGLQGTRLDAGPQHWENEHPR